MNITTTYDEAMVKAMIAEAVAKEREECAKVCDLEQQSFMRDAFGSSDGRYDWKADGAMNCAAAIRTRGEMK